MHSGTVDYIFGRLQCSEVALKSIQKSLKAQANLNGNVAFWIRALAVCAILNSASCYNMIKTVKKLRMELDEMKAKKENVRRND